MTADPDWVPPEVDTSKASIARVYDWWLGGTHNFRADQDAARALISVSPNVRAGVRANRAFLIRAVRYLAREAGIRQFIDVGSGIPTEQNVHQVAREIAPGAHVVYVDNDDVAVAHSRLLLDGDQDVTIVQADIRDPAAILGHPDTRRLIDFSQPVALLMVAVLHFIPDSEHPDEILAAFRAAVAPGSYLAICHGCRDVVPDEAASFEKVYNSRTGAQGSARTREEIARLFDGFTLVEPGLVWMTEWRPDSPDDVPADPSSLWAVAGVGRYDGGS